MLGKDKGAELSHGEVQALLGVGVEVEAGHYARHRGRGVGAGVNSGKVHHCAVQQSGEGGLVRGGGEVGEMEEGHVSMRVMKLRAGAREVSVGRFRG